jgi:hypothetical protein
MKAFWNNPFLKEEFLSNPVVLFRKMYRDERRLAYELSVPSVLIALIQGIVDLVPAEKPTCWETYTPSIEAQSWLVRLFDAIPVGADLSTVVSQFGDWLLSDQEAGVIRYVTSEDQREAIMAVADLYGSGYGAFQPRVPYNGDSSRERRERWLQACRTANTLAYAAEQAGDQDAANALRAAAELGAARAYWSDEIVALGRPRRAMQHVSQAAFPNSIIVPVSSILKRLFRVAPVGSIDGCLCNGLGGCLCWR